MRRSGRMPELTCMLGPDCAGTVLTGLLNHAEQTIDAAVYEVGPSYAWMLTRAARRGVRVRLILDAHRSDGNAQTATLLQRAGGDCRVLGGGAAAAHWKLLLLDGRRVAVGTGNLIWRDAPRDAHGRFPPEAPPLAGTREWWAVASEDPHTTETAAAAFDAAWRCASAVPEAWAAVVPLPPQAAVGTPAPQVAPLAPLVCSDQLRLVVGAEAVAATLLSLATRARGRLFATVPYVHLGMPAVAALLTAMRGAGAGGADVRLLLGEPPDGAAAAALRCAGVAVRQMNPARSTRGHAKGMVSDDAVAVSSSNWSAGGLSLNHEAALIATDSGAAGYYADAFERDWQASDDI